METIQFIGACIGYTVSAITLLTLIIKPIRTKLIGWMKGINDTDETAESIRRMISGALTDEEKVSAWLKFIDKCVI